MEEKGSDSLRGRSFLGGAENYPLCKSVVDHDQESIKAFRRWEVGDEVTRYLLEGTGGGGSDGGEGRYHGMCVGLGLLTLSASFYVLSHELSEAWPPVIGRYELPGF